MKPRLILVLSALFLFLIPVAAWAQDPPSVSLEMTLTEDTNDMPSDECGVSDTLAVGEGAEVEVCYTITNTGDVTLNFHDLEDTEFGVLLDDFGFALDPDASVSLTQTVIASANVTFNGTWTAFNAGPTDEVQSMDSATLTVVPPSISLDVTLAEDSNGLPSDDCGVSSTLLVQAGTVVEVCYTVTNTGLTPLNLHDLEDTELGIILSAFAFELLPGASVSLTQTVAPTADTTYVGTWTAYNEGPVNVAQATDSATLQVPIVQVPIVQVPTIGWWAKAIMVLLLLLFSGMYFHGRQGRPRS